VQSLGKSPSGFGSKSIEYESMSPAVPLSITRMEFFLVGYIHAAIVKIDVNKYGESSPALVFISIDPVPNN
jgi:hypothetical protein